MGIKGLMKNNWKRVFAGFLIFTLVAGVISRGVFTESAQAAGVNTEEVAGNLIQNSSFETANFGTAHAYNQWYTTTGSTLTQTDERYESGNQSLRVSNRTACYSNAQYRVWFGSMQSGTKYELSGYVQAAEETSVYLIANVWGWGGPTGNEYPCVTMYLDTATVNSTDWTKLAGTFTVTYTESSVEGKQDAIVTWGDQTATISAVSGVDNVEIMVQQTFDVTTYPDLYMDSFLLEVAKETAALSGHKGETNTENDADNLIANSSFETDDFGTDHNTGVKWYKAPGSPVELSQFAEGSHSGSHSLMVSNRTAYWNTAQYRVWFGNMTSGTEYKLSGYVASSEETPVCLVANVWGWGGPTENPYPCATMYLDTATANAIDWTKLAGTFTVTYSESSVEGKQDALVTWGDQSVTLYAVSGVDCIEIMVQQPGDATTYPDLYLDSFLLEKVIKESEEKPEAKPPTGHSNAENTELIEGNLINNGSFETDDFGTDHNTGVKWYKAPGSPVELSQFAEGSHSGSHSLMVSNRTAYWNTAQYRAWFGNMTSGTEYKLSGYVASSEETPVCLVANVWGWGGSTENPYPCATMYLDTATANAIDWTKLAGTFTVTYSESSVEGKQDALVTWGDQSVTLSAVSGVDCIEIMVQQPGDATTYPDLYLDSFLLEKVIKESEEKPEAKPPTGHSNAENTELIEGNLINNGSFEANDYANEYVFDKWYTVSGVNLEKDTTYSHSGNASLKITGRDLFWHRAEYRVEGGHIKSGHPYEISGYVSFAEDANVEMYIQVWGYGGPESDPYPSVVITADSASVAAGNWENISALLTITAKESEEEGYFDFDISVEGIDETYEIKHVKGLSAVDIFVQETYSDVTPRQDMYLDSFKMVDKFSKDDLPVLKGHTNAENTELNEDNLIKNAGFETNDFVHEEYIFGKWYTMEGCPAILTQDTTFSHSGKASLKVLARDLFWHRPEYRVEGTNITMGHPYEVSGYVAFQESATADLILQVYGAGGPENDPYPNLAVWLDSTFVKGGEWTKLSGTITITSKESGEEGYYDYTITVKETGDVYELKHVTMISGIQIMVQEAYDAVTGHQDMYLDSFLLVDKAPKTPMPIPTGHAGAANTEDLEENLINNSSFEADLFTDVLNFGLWYTNGTGHSIKQVSEYSHSGEHSVRIYNRKAANSTLVYKVEGGTLKLGTEHTLSGYVAAAQETEVSLILTVYGYAGTVENRTFPFKTVVLSEKMVKDWTQLGGSFTITYEGDHLYLAIGEDKFDIGECIGLSGIEFYVLIDETVANYTTDLYLDSFSLLAGASDTSGDGNIDTENPDDTQKDDFGGDSADISDSDKTDDKDNDDVDGKGSNPYIIWIVIGVVVVLCSIGIIVYLVMKSRKKSEA